MIRLHRIFESLLVLTLIGWVPGEVGTSTILSARNLDTRAKAETPPDKDTPRIIGGEAAPPGAYPWMVALVDADEEDAFLGQFCGGSLVHPQWVLTAAHCVDFSTPDDIDVIVGSHDLSEAGGERISIKQIIIHEDFETLFGLAVAADIALLKLERPSEMSVIALNPSARNPLAAPGTLAISLGWGARNTKKPGFPVELHQVQVPLLSDTDCPFPFAGADFFCAGVTEGGKDSCSGDSGGPLVLPDGEGGWLQVGITSASTCGGPGLPGAYTRISTFVDWIDQPIYNTIYFSQFGDGEGFTSDVVVYNPSLTDTATGSVTVWDALGNELGNSSLIGRVNGVTHQGATDFNFSLPPLAATTISSGGIGDVVVGSATVSADSPVAGVIRFHIAGIGIAGVGPAEPTSRAVVAPVRRQGNLSTGVAIRNASREEISVHLTLRDDGQVIRFGGITDLTIPAQGQVAKFIQELFPELDTANFQGTLLYTTS